MSYKTVEIDQPATCRTPHHGFVLANGVKVVIISDPNTQKSTAAMSIRTGTHNDPVELEGLAHLCEHMCFLGTEEYPSEGEYNKFVGQHGGHSNAWTEDGHTQYYFNCSNGAFDEGLRMFLHFFVSPLFTATSLEREVEAVHSEDEKNHSSDYWCWDEIRKLHLANKAHPHSRYGNGNKKTLWDVPQSAGVDIRGKLLAFFEKYYVAENACLTLYTPAPVEDLLAIADPILSRMRRGSKTEYDFGVAPFVVSNDADALKKGHAIAPGTWVQLKATKALQRLSVYFPLPYSHAQYEAKPACYASHVIGHECNGSLLAVLKAEGLADSLSAGSGHGVDDHYDNFQICASLTAKGVREMKRVAALFFEAIEHMRRDGVIGRVFDEMEAGHNLTFNLSEVDRPSMHASTASRDANRYGLERCLSGDTKVFRRDLDAAKQVFDYLRPSNAFFVVELQDVDAAIEAGTSSATEGLALPVAELPVTATRTALVTEHHKAQYGIGQVDTATLEEWATPKSLHPLLATPGVNPYIATDFSVAELSKDEYPTAKQTAYGKAFVKHDSRFALPKAFLAIAIDSPLAYDTPIHRFFVRVATQVAKHVLTEQLYFAELGALEVDVNASTNGFRVVVSGAAEKLPVLAEEVVRTVLNPATYAASENVYTDKARVIIRTLLGHYVGQPYSDAQSRISAWINKVQHTVTEVLDAAIGPHLDNVETAASTSAPPAFADFTAFMAELFNTVHVETMWVGNSKADQPAQIEAMMCKLLAGRTICKYEDLVDQGNVLQLPSREDMTSTPAVSPSSAPLFGSVIHERTYSSKDPNDATIVTLQCGQRTPRQQVLADCAMSLINSVFFDTLRTTETVGYIVGSGAAAVEHTMNVTFVAQSAKFDAHYLLTRIYAFLAALPAHYKAIPDSEFERVFEAQRSARRDVPKSISAEGGAHWSRRKHCFGFAHRELELAVLENITRDDILAFVNTYISNDSFDVRAITACLFAKQETLDHFRSHTEAFGFIDLEPVITHLRPKETEATGKEEITLPSFDTADDKERFITLLHLGNRAAFRDNTPIVAKPNAA